jgi:hypothetical protein
MKNLLLIFIFGILLGLVSLFEDDPKKENYYYGAL